MRLQNKMKTRQELALMAKQWRAKHVRLGFTSGAFDLLHAGHVDYLEKAKAECDVLLVGVNSDASVKRYKGMDRPIISEDQRIKVVSALESVDYVFRFDERRNHKNIEMLQPDCYIKAGDYSVQSLTSREAVEAYGGEVICIPVTESISSSIIMERIAGLEDRGERWIAEGEAEFLAQRPSKSCPAVFLDRDGTINKDIHYLHEPERFELLPGAVKGLKRFQDMGYKLVIITNQPGIGLGYFTKEDFYRVNLEMLKQLSAHDIRIDKIYFCPHSKADQCACRKPEQALVRRAVEALNLDLHQSVFIGDKTTDIETGHRAGMRTIQIVTGPDKPKSAQLLAFSLDEAASIILELERK